MRRRLPDVPQRLVRAAREHFQAAVGVVDDLRIAHEHAAER